MSDAPRHGEIRNWHHEAGGRADETLVDDGGREYKLPYDLKIVTACEQYCANCETWVRCDNVTAPTSPAGFKAKHGSGDCTP